ncbi:MAG TPA: alpha/beta hydrolase [Thermoanaerobaculia bacterium]|nr:alpha/beta hydrolase [Thermoanaerobaculia bacterium]
MPPLESTLRTHDGLALIGEHHLRPGCRARVVIVHGYAEHRGRYASLAAALGEAGYECHLLDLRGHGGSGGVRGFVSRFEEYFADLDLFLTRIEEVAAGGIPLILLGHSLGGLISLGYVLQRPGRFDALAVSSPFLAPAMPVPPLQAGLAAVTSRLAPKLLGPSPIRPESLSHDTEVVAAYEADPLVFKTLSPRWFMEVREAQEEVLERAGEIRLPALFLIGGADPIADPERSRSVFERLGSADKHLEIYQDFLHEVFNETGRQRVIDDLVNWLDRRAPPVSPRPAR